MLTRQKILLALVSHQGGPVTPTVLVKLAFLARNETLLKSDQTFYDFVPYKFGPFSFGLYREVDGLKKKGYLEVDDSDRISISPKLKHLALRKTRELPESTLWAVADITNSYGNLPQRTLLKGVYEKYPWFAARSELKDLKPPQVPRLRVASPAIYTVGYEGKSVDSFFKGLLRAGIKVILDVRANPVSRKYGFAKKSMREIATKLDIDYCHIPELGIPGELRKSLSDYDSYQRLLDEYECSILPNRSKEISQVADYMTRTPAALLCMEKDVNCCHRGRLASAVACESRLPIRNL